MESARAAAETLLLRGAQGDGIGGGAAGGGGVGAGTMSSDIDAAIAEVSLFLGRADTTVCDVFL